MNEPNKIEFYTLATISSLVLCNTLAFGARLYK